MKNIPFQRFSVGSSSHEINQAQLTYCLGRLKYLSNNNQDSQFELSKEKYTQKYKEVHNPKPNKQPDVKLNLDEPFLKDCKIESQSENITGLVTSGLSTNQV